MPDDSAKNTPAAIDVENLRIIRDNVDRFLSDSAKRHLTQEGQSILDIAPQVHKGIAPYVPAGMQLCTLDIDPKSGSTFIADICATNDGLIANESFDFVVCTEVLEHTLNPFAAISEIWRILRHGGTLFLTVPFNFRIHGPLPDCWRFTEHGLRALLGRFSEVSISAVESIDRPLMPIHYTVVAVKA